MVARGFLKFDPSPIGRSLKALSHMATLHAPAVAEVLLGAGRRL